MKPEPGKLYIVATPIGNLKDITLRALEILKAVDLIAAEDTRRTKILIVHYGIKKPLLSFNEYNKHRRIPKILAEMTLGKDVALVSDAGTPSVSDPGAQLVKEVWARGMVPVPIPGPSAVTAAASISGLASGGFYFAGFLPRRKGKRKKRIQELGAVPDPLIFYEAPNRVTTLIRELGEAWGARTLVMTREITKLHEELWRGSLLDFQEYFQDRAWKGEVTLMVSGAGKKRDGLAKSRKILVCN
jgi:16S rRNA (cytidine1402-2'-O)-methyltransferase